MRTWCLISSSAILRSLFSNIHAAVSPLSNDLVVGSICRLLIVLFNRVSLFIQLPLTAHPWLDGGPASGTNLLSLMRNLACILLPSIPSDISVSSPFKERLHVGNMALKCYDSLIIHDRRDSLPFALHTKPIQVGVEGQGEGGSGLGGKREMDLFYGYLRCVPKVIKYIWRYSPS